jgi:hypothetical protein
MEAPKVEGASTFETSVNVQRIARRTNPKDGHLGTHRRENIKAYVLWFFLQFFMSVAVLLTSHIYVFASHEC